MYPVEFPRNQWYVAARSAEVDDQLFARRLLGEPVVLYRASAGHPIALADRCPHRQFPFSKSRRVGDTIECGYHGLQFDSNGRCLQIPQQDEVPSYLHAQAYPVRERWGFIWIWMGE